MNLSGTINLEESSVITYQTTNGQTGTYVDNCYYPYPQWSDNYHYFYNQWYPYTITEKSKTETAFRVASKLLEEKVIGKLTLKQFIDLVNKIANII